MKKIYLCIAFLGFIVALGFGVTVEALPGEVYIQNFNDTDEINRDFGAYYLYTMGGISEKEQVGNSAYAGTRWYIEDNAVRRQEISDDIDLSIGTNSFAILTLETKTYINFELTVDYKNGGDTYFWPVIAFRQSEKGRYFLEDGAGVFVQNEGLVTVWGGEGVGGPFESSPVPGYGAATTEWHTLKIVVDGLDLFVYLDDMVEPALFRSFQSGFFKAGYISLISVNNSSSFRNLRIVEKPVKPIDGATKPQQPVPDAGTPDSLDSIGTPVDEIDELDGLVQTGPEDSRRKGCFSAKNLTFLVLLPLPLLLFRRKK